MKKLQVASFLIFIIAIIFSFNTLNASTLDNANYSLQLSGANQNSDKYYTGIISGGGPLRQDGIGKIYLANSGNTFSGGVRPSGDTNSTSVIGIGYPPVGLTTAIPASGNSYMGVGRTIRFDSLGGILELGCDMSAANCTLRAQTTNTTNTCTIRGFNQTSAYAINLSTFQAAVQARGIIAIGAGATVIFGFTLPSGSAGTHYSAFNVSGTSTNAGVLRLFNAASASTAPININAYGTLDCSLCTTALATALSNGTLTVRANSTLRFPNVTGAWTKPIVLSP